ncbi:MAG: response regulator [Ignavibacteriales bacterium]|nr:response regulator [Ignavibacteriales bacterium]
MLPVQDNQKAVISELLKSADRAIRDNKLAHAYDFINKVFEIDQRNIYALAYRERLLYLTEAAAKEQSTREKAAATKAPSAPASSQMQPAAKTEPPPAQAPSDPRYPPAAPAQQYVPAPEHAETAGHSIQKSPAATEAYRRLLAEVWEDGNIDPTEQARIESMRETFEISKAEHAPIELEVRTSLFLDAVRRSYQKGVTTFDDLQKRYRLTQFEMQSVQPRLFQLLQSLKSRGFVMVVDDDEAFLSLVKRILEDTGYRCLTAISGEDGIRALDAETPDIILCDINFTKPNMSGFAFYERLRAVDRLTSTPFIFLSGLDQTIVVRTGKQMGADDYLTKPIDAELLLATVEGKIRRARELKSHYNL